MQRKDSEKFNPPTMYECHIVRMSLMRYRCTYDEISAYGLSADLAYETLIGILYEMKEYINSLQLNWREENSR